MIHNVNHYCDCKKDKDLTKSQNGTRASLGRGKMQRTDEIEGFCVYCGHATVQMYPNTNVRRRNSGFKTEDERQSWEAIDAGYTSFEINLSNRKGI